MKLTRDVQHEKFGAREIASKVRIQDTFHISLSSTFPPNSAINGYAPEFLSLILISSRLSAGAVSALPKVWLLITLEVT